MPNWNDILGEVHQAGPHDLIRAKYLEKISQHTDRNILVYYSGWLQKPHIQTVDLAINDSDKTGFMTCSHGLNRERGLDLILHTPGGDVAATESIIDYLHSLYDGDVRAIIPQLAMSAGTLIALSCKSIMMGRQSSLGPVDPQIAGMPAQGILEEFAQASRDIEQNVNKQGLWRPILERYWPTLLSTCKHAIDWSDDLMRKYLTECMLKNAPDQAEKIEQISNLLGKQSTSKNHSRHINRAVAKDSGLVIEDLEDDNELQDLILSLHHALTITFSQTPACKVIENQDGISHILGLPQ